MIESHKFPNGLKLMLERLPECRSTGIAVGFPAGGRTEEARLSGISHYLEHMIFKGTEKVKHFDRCFERIGARTNGVTEADTTVYLAECPKENSFKTLNMWLRLLSEAAIDPEEFECERGVILSEYFITEDNPDSLVEKNATFYLFKGHPLASTVIGSESSIKAISRRDMVNYFRSQYDPSNSVIWVSGDLRMDRLIEQVEKQKNWVNKGSRQATPFRVFKPEGPTVIELPRQTTLAQIGLACSNSTQSPQKRAALQILSSILSSGQSSILRRRLVLEHELTHRLRVVVSDYREAGMFLTAFATRPTKVPVALSILTETVQSLRKDTSKFKEEFQVARNHALGSVSTGIDTQLMWRAVQGAWETLRRGYCSWDEKLSSLKSLSFEQFTKIVKEILRPERIALILAGEFKEGITNSVEW